MNRLFKNAQCECFGSGQYVIDTTSAEFLLDIKTRKSSGSKRKRLETSGGWIMILA